MENLIGRKVRGFKFDDDYVELMDKHIGEIGVVNSVRGNKAIVVFKYNSWHYPLDQIKEHLVDEVPTLEEVKDYFKEAEKVLSLFNQEFKMDNETIYISKSGESFFCIESLHESSRHIWGRKEGYAKIITAKQKQDTPSYYDNTNGSIYKFCNDQKLNAWEFDIIKRIVRSRKKGMFKEDLEKTKVLIDLYLKEFNNE